MAVDLEDFEYATADRFRHVLAQRTILSARTPRELATALVPNTASSQASVSITARAFYRIRSWLADVLDIDPRSITPATRCADLLPDYVIRRSVWAYCRELLAPHAPRLHRPRLIIWPMAILSATAAMSIILVLNARTSLGLALVAGGLTGIGLLSLLCRLTRAWTYEFIPASLTVGALAHHAVAYGSPILGDLEQPQSLSQTLEVIEALAHLEIGAPRVHPDATWEELEQLARAN